MLVFGLEERFFLCFLFAKTQNTCWHVFIGNHFGRTINHSHSLHPPFPLFGRFTATHESCIASLLFLFCWETLIYLSSLYTLKVYILFNRSISENFYGFSPPWGSYSIPMPDEIYSISSLLPVGCVQKASIGRHSRSILIRYLNHLNWLLLTWKSSSCTPSSLWMSHRGNSFWLVVSYSFHHYPNLMTIGGM